MPREKMPQQLSGYRPDASDLYRDHYQNKQFKRQEYSKRIFNAIQSEELDEALRLKKQRGPQWKTLEELQEIEAERERKSEKAAVLGLDAAARYWKAKSFSAGMKY
jgi:hypothetical protein